MTKVILDGVEGGEGGQGVVPILPLAGVGVQAPAVAAQGGN